MIDNSNPKQLTMKTIGIGLSIVVCIGLISYWSIWLVHTVTYPIALNGLVEDSIRELVKSDCLHK